MTFLARVLARATWVVLLSTLVAVSLLVRLAAVLWHNALFLTGLGLAGYVVWYELRHQRDETSTTS